MIFPFISSLSGKTSLFALQTLGLYYQPKYGDYFHFKTEVERFRLIFSSLNRSGSLS